MTRQQWIWFALYCAVVGVSSVLLMVYPVAGWTVGVPTGIWYWRAVPKANQGHA